MQSFAALVDDLDAQVRDVVRREGVDPQRDAAHVRRIAEQVVRAHDERSLTGIVSPVDDAHSMIGELVARVSGFGPLQRFLEDPEIEEIWVNDPSRVFVARNGRHELSNVILTQAQVQELVERMLEVLRSPDRPVPAVRGRDVARGASPARRARGHQP